MTSEQVVRWTGAHPFPVAHLSGGIDLANAADWFAAVTLGIDGAAGVVVDLSDVTFIDSSFFAELVWLSRACPVRLVAPAGQPRRLLEMAGFDQVYPMFNTVAGAQAQRDR